MLYQDINSPGHLGPKTQAQLRLFWKQVLKRVAYLNIPRRFNVIMDLSLKMRWQSCLKNIMLIFEGQQQNTSIPTQPLWKPLTRSWQNCCLNQWMPKSFKTLKNLAYTDISINLGNNTEIKKDGPHTLSGVKIRID